MIEHESIQRAAARLDPARREEENEQRRTRREEPGVIEHESIITILFAVTDSHTRLTHNTAVKYYHTHTRLTHNTAVKYYHIVSNLNTT